MKTCIKCGEEKSLELFDKDVRCKFGRNSVCKVCRQRHHVPYSLAKPLYGVWSNLRQRCNNPKTINYKYYGGRGITCDPRWDSYDAFLEDMGPSFQSGLTLDRIDVDGNYCKENCRWATRLEQGANRKRMMLFEYYGEQLTLSEIGRRTKITDDALYWHVVTKGRDLYATIKLKHSEKG